MGGRPAGLETAALIDGDVDQHRSGLHGLDHGAGDELGRRGAGDEHCADDEVGVANQLFDGVRRRVHGLQLAGEHRGQLAQSLDRTVHHGHVGAQTDGHFGRMGAGYAAAQNHDFGGRYAGYAAQQHAEAAVGLLQAIGAHLHRHAAGDLAHRRQQRQRSVRRRHGFIRDGRGARGHERFGLLAVGGQVQVGEQGLSGAQQLAFAPAAAPSPSR